MATFHQLCSTCTPILERFTLLNPPETDDDDPDNLLWKRDIAKDDPRYPLRQGLPDTDRYATGEDGEVSAIWAFEPAINHHANGAALEISSHSCHLCGLLWGHLSTVRYGTLRQAMNGDVKGKADQTRATAQLALISSPEQLYVRVGRHQEGRGWLLLTLYSGVHEEKIPELRSTLCIMATAIVEANLPFELDTSNAVARSLNTNSDEVLQLAKSWIEDCTTQHSCKQKNPMLEQVLPTRVLDVKSKWPKLYFPPPGSELDYICLSHCWGGADIYKLTRNSEFELRKGVDIDVLPKTFQDAIDITRRLGHRYLWIDSLCIMQDDPDDWTQHALRMANIYGNCFLSLGALWGENSHSGCYSSRNPLTYWPCILPHRKKLTAWDRGYWPFHNEHFATARPNAPLLLRGWVHQERCFAQRTLYFGQSGIYWECLRLGNDEMDTKRPAAYAMPDIAPKDVFRWGLHLQESGGQVFPHMDGDENPCPLYPALQFLSDWYEMIGQYTTGALTFEKDKLAAIASLTMYVAGRTNLTFTNAGLWEELLLEELAWRAADPRKTTRATTYIGPSFSWVSIHGYVKRWFNRHCSSPENIPSPSNIGEPHSGRRRYIASIVNTNVQPLELSTDTYSVKPSYIRLRCHVTRFKAELVRETEPGYTYDEFKYPFTHPFVKEREFDLDLSKHDKENLHYPFWFAMDVAADLDAEHSAMEVACVPLIEWSHGSGKTHVVGLVLKQVEDNIFQRVGMLEDCWEFDSESDRNRWIHSGSQEIIII